MDVVVWLVGFVLETIGRVMAWVVAWYTLVTFFPETARGFGEATVRAAEKRQRERKRKRA